MIDCVEYCKFQERKLTSDETLYKTFEKVVKRFHMKWELKDKTIKTMFQTNVASCESEQFTTFVVAHQPYEMNRKAFEIVCLQTVKEMIFSLQQIKIKAKEATVLGYQDIGTYRLG